MNSKAPHNRKRRKAKRQDPYPELDLDRSYIVELPIEVISNILQYVFPADLLTLTRTSQLFRKTLLHQQQQHIWRTSRTLFPHATIPEPIQISEMAMASLLFDERKCSICGTLGSPLKSLVPPTRVCSATKCTDTFRSLYEVPPPEWSTLVYGIVPSVTVTTGHPYSFLHTPSLYFTSLVKLCRKETMQMVLQDIEAGLRKDELEVKYNTTFEQTQSVNRHLEDLDRISNQLMEVQSHLDEKTQRFAKSKASQLKLDNIKITNSPTYCAERRRLRRAFETRGFNQKDWDAYPPQGATRNPQQPTETVGQLIAKELQALHDAAQRRRAEGAARGTRDAVKVHWNQLKNSSGMVGHSGSAIPRWNEFQALPVVDTLLRPKTCVNDVQDLKRDDSTLTKMVKANVDTWNSRTQAQFRKMLNVPIPKKNQVPEPGTIPPLDRVTSLFECTKCKSVGIGLAQEGTLTFRSAVKHRCTGASKKFKWDTNLFKPDQLGINIARYAANLSGRAEDKTARADMDALGPRFLCKLCSKPIVLTYKDLVGHLKRHEVEDLQGSIEYLDQPLEASPNIPSSGGLVEKRRRGCKKGFCSDPDSKDLFICRHCDKPFLWNALVSHVKAKHHFSDIRDEDFYPKAKS